MDRDRVQHEGDPKRVVRAAQYLQVGDAPLAVASDSAGKRSIKHRLQHARPRLRTPSHASHYFSESHIAFRRLVHHSGRDLFDEPVGAIARDVDAPIVREMGADALERALVRPRRRQSGELRLLRLWSTPEGETGCLRWDPVFLQPASVQGRQAFDALRDRLEIAMPTQAVMMIEPGEAIVIDNWRMLHARPAIPSDRRDRHLQRVYLRSLY